MKLPARRRVATLLDLTPMIDCVFLLLIFFVLASSFQRDPALPLSLPRAAHAAPADRPAVAVTLDDKGGLWLRDQPLALPALGAALASLAAREGPIEQLVVRADAGARADAIVAVLDAARAAGVAHVALAAQPPP